MPNELADFKSFLEKQLENGHGEISPEECVDLWRSTHPTDEDLADSVAAVKRALDDMANGDKGRPAREFIRELREKLEVDSK